MAKTNKKVERNDNINKDKMKKSLDKYTSDFTTRLGDYVERYIKENNLKYTDIYKDTGIAKSSFTNYVSDRLPRYTDTLIFIKDYFNIPFSYLFKETDAKEIDNIDIGLAYGLDDNAIKKLKQLKKESENDSLDNNYSNTIKLFLINSIINDTDFLESFSRLVPTLIGRKQIDEKFNGEKTYQPFSLDTDFIDYLKYSAYEQYIDYLNRLIKLDKVPKSITNNSIEIAKKYSGNRQKNIRSLEEK